MIIDWLEVPYYISESLVLSVDCLKNDREKFCEYRPSFSIRFCNIWNRMKLLEENMKEKERYFGFERLLFCQMAPTAMPALMTHPLGNNLPFYRSDNDKCQKSLSPQRPPSHFTSSSYFLLFNRPFRLFFSSNSIC